MSLSVQPKDSFQLFSKTQSNKVINEKNVWKTVLTAVTVEFLCFPLRPFRCILWLLRGLDPQYGNHSYPTCLTHVKARLTQYPMHPASHTVLLFNCLDIVQSPKLLVTVTFLHAYVLLYYACPACSDTAHTLQMPVIIYRMHRRVRPTVCVCVNVCVLNSWVIVLGLCCSCTLWISMQYKLSIHQIVRTKEFRVFWLILRTSSFIYLFIHASAAFVWHR